MSPSINNDLNEIFKQDFIRVEQNNVTFNEKENRRDTTIVKIKFLFDGKIIIVNQEKLILENFFKKILKSKGLTSINDGVFIVHYNSQYYLNLCELKSTLDFNNYIRAKTQLEATFLKVLIFLNILSKFSINDLIVNCFIVSNKNTEIKVRAEKELNHIPPINFDFNTLILKKEIKLLKKNLSISTFPIKDDYLLSNVHLHLIEGNNREINITDYFK